MTETFNPAPPTLTQRLAAEFLGIFVLVFLGVGSVVIINATYPGVAGINVFAETAIGLSFGIAVMVMVYSVGRISGGHFNPAVSLGAALGGRIRWAEAGIYMVVQLVGATAGAAALFGVAKGYPGFVAKGHMGANSYGSHGSGIHWWAALLLELVLTAIFVFVILAVTDIRNEHPALAPLAIGFTLTAIHYVAIPATGTSVNPARSIGPALFSGSDALGQVWLFILGPMIGGALAGVLYPLVFGQGADPVQGSGWRFGTAVPAGVPGYGLPDQLQEQWDQGSGPTQGQSRPSESGPDDTQVRPE